MGSGPTRERQCGHTGSTGRPDKNGYSVLTHWVQLRGINIIATEVRTGCRVCMALDGRAMPCPRYHHTPEAKCRGTNGTASLCYSVLLRGATAQLTCNHIRYTVQERERILWVEGHVRTVVPVQPLPCAGHEEGHGSLSVVPQVQREAVVLQQPVLGLCTAIPLLHIGAPSPIEPPPLWQSPPPPAYQENMKQRNAEHCCICIQGCASV